MTTTSALRKLSQYNKYRRDPSQKVFPAPWDSFRQDAETAIGNVLVSHQVNKRVRGTLHEESLFSALDKKDNQGVPMFAIRKQLTKLNTFSQLRHVADPVIKKILIDHLVFCNKVVLSQACL